MAVYDPYLAPKAETAMTDSFQFSRRLIVGMGIVAMPSLALAQAKLLEQGKSLLGGAGGKLSANEISGGLKEALKVGSKNVVGRLGKADGYNADPAIRIPLPGPLQKIEGALKALGAAGLLGDLQTKMNRAAEQAAPKALDIFVDAIGKMTIADAQGILSGPQDAATQYFRKTTSDGLTGAFKPIVDSSLSGVGAVSAFKSVQDKAAGIPMAGKSVANFNLTDFTVGKALDGVFHYKGKEEAAIRTNPAARTTDLLKKVFA